MYKEIINDKGVWINRTYDLLIKNVDKAYRGLSYLSDNKNAIPILEQNTHIIHWSKFAENPNAIDL